MSEPTREANPLRTSGGSWDFRLAAGVDAALVFFLFAGFFSDKLSEPGALSLIVTITAYTTSLVGWRTTLKGAAVVKGPGRAPVVPGQPREG